MKHVALIGAGLMGAGLARLFKRGGWQVSAFDLDRTALAKITDARLGQDLADTVQGADLVIEAVSERLAVKQAVFADLVSVTGEKTLLATNSSVIPVGDIAAHIDDLAAQRILGMHFWNPPDIVPLVEVIPGPRTAEETLVRGMAMLSEVGKEPIRVSRDVVPGNRLQNALWREAIALVEEGVCTPADVDHIVKRSFGLRLPILGPLENMDLIGLELTRQIQDVVLPQLSRATSPSSELTERLIRGDTGAKSGAGFYHGWTPERVEAVQRRLAQLFSPQSDGEIVTLGTEP